MSSGEKLSAYLREHGLTPDEVARRATIPSSELESILAGERAMYVDELRALCYALGVIPETFIDAT